MRVLHSGSALAFQAKGVGSIPTTRFHSLSFGKPWFQRNGVTIKFERLESVSVLIGLIIFSRDICFLSVFVLY